MSSQIPTRPLGRNGPLVPALGFGAMGLSAFYGSTGTDAERLAVLDRAYELGVRHWDTADMYSDNEDLLGVWFRANPTKRSSIFLATKFGGILQPDGLQLRSDPEYVRQACEKSLKRLGVEYIDLYYCHRVDGVTPVEKTVKAMVELQQEGKIRHLGFSELSAESLRRACNVHHIAALQMEYSPFELSIESAVTPLLSTCREFGVALVAYSPLARGFMSGKYTSPADFEEGDFRKSAPRFSDENFPKNVQLLRKFEEVALRKGVTSGQLCLAWLLAQGDDIFVIPGTKKIKYLDENAGAANVVLTDSEIKEIRGFVDAAEVHGERVSQEWEHSLFGDTPAL